MSWQHADEDLHSVEGHIPVSRCSSVIALQLASDPITKVRNRGRRVKRIFGDVYDPFAPWRVLSMQCYPDWKSSVDAHDSTKHYVNGPEAFLVTLRSEYNDAQKRLKEVYNRISDLVRSPVSLIVLSPEKYTITDQNGGQENNVILWRLQGSKLTQLPARLHVQAVRKRSAAL